MAVWLHKKKKEGTNSDSVWGEETHGRHSAHARSSLIRAVRAGVFQKATWGCGRSFLPQICRGLLLARLWLAEAVWIGSQRWEAAEKWHLGINKAQLRGCIWKSISNQKKNHLMCVAAGWGWCNKIYLFVVLFLSCHIDFWGSAWGLWVHLCRNSEPHSNRLIFEHDLPFSIHVHTGDLNRVWCVAAVLAFDPRLSGGARWQRVKVKGKGWGKGDGGVREHLTGVRAPCLGVQNPDSLRRLSEGRGCRVWTPLDPLVLLCLLPLTSLALEGESEAGGRLEQWRGKRFPGWRKRGTNLNIPNPSDKHQTRFPF